MNDFQFSYPKYLDAKESVDDQSLNRRVEAQFYDRILSKNPERVRILEVGGGTGATLLRILDHLRSKDLRSLKYTFVERRADNIERARNRIEDWAEDSSYLVTSQDNVLQLTSRNDGRGLSKAMIELKQSDFIENDVGLANESVDAVVAQALLDQIDLGEGIRKLDSLLTDGGIWYLPIHFDGLTTFEPTIDSQLDDQIIRIYDQSIPHPTSGRQLLSLLPEVGSRIVAAGSSDWVVFSEGNKFRSKESYFLKCILFFIHSELIDHHDITDKEVLDWIEERRRQVENSTLLYMTHQLDICAEKDV